MKACDIERLHTQGRRDALVVVSRDLTRCSEVGHIARTLQAALDDWEHVGPRLDEVAEGLETGAQPTMRFHESMTPRRPAARLSVGRRFGLCQSCRTGAQGPQCRDAGQLLDRSADVPRAARTAFLAPRDPIVMADEAYGIDMEGEIAVVVDDVPMGAVRGSEPRSVWSCWSTTSRCAA
jgi:fumarylacetoacetate (FAA) hydrolase